MMGISSDASSGDEMPYTKVTHCKRLATIWNKLVIPSDLPL
jgi:hypothetical protein